MMKKNIENYIVLLRLVYIQSLMGLYYDRPSSGWKDYIESKKAGYLHWEDILAIATLSNAEFRIYTKAVIQLGGYTKRTLISKALKEEHSGGRPITPADGYNWSNVIIPTRSHWDNN